MTQPAVDFSAVDQAFNAGDNQRGLTLLQQLCERHPKNAQLLYRTAVVEEQIGDKQRAKGYYRRLLQEAGNNPLTYLYAGALYDTLGEKELARVLYSLGQDLDARLCFLHQIPGVNSQTAQRSQMARKCLADHQHQLHQQAVGSLSETISEAFWVQESLSSVPFRNAQQKPHLFYIPGLSPRPYVNVADEKWAQSLESGLAEIKTELETALKAESSKLEPYLHQGLKSHSTFESLAGSDNWSALHLYRDGEKDDTMASYFPKTLALIHQAPTYGLDDRPYEVFFSLLKANQNIPPHYGLSNHSLTVHLPVEVPENCYLEVAGKKHQWQQGQMVAFDDTFLHSAHNLSEQLRIVLIFSIWQPELNENDKKAIQRSFIAKQDWVKGRQQQLQQLFKTER